MKNKFIKSLILITLVTGSSIYLSGCMMAWMGMMHGSGHEMENHNQSRTIIKEYNSGEYKITAEFPSMVTGNSDVCRVKIYDNATDALQTDAEVSLEILMENTRRDKESAQDLSPIKIKRTRFENGYFVFLPDISATGSYRLTFSIKRIGTDIFDPPIEIEYITENHSEMNNNHSHTDSGNILTSPYFYVGAAAMAVMMIFIIR
ncbi:MAG: hypothetical protein M1495_21320 [Bacteroidetes bacterium]|nr:hypothetical protein [Bacteroidota bacterium]